MAQVKYSFFNATLSRPGIYKPRKELQRYGQRIHRSVFPVRPLCPQRSDLAETKRRVGEIRSARKLCL